MMVDDSFEIKTIIYYHRLYHAPFDQGFTSLLQLDQITAHDTSFELGEINQDQEKEENKTVTLQEPEITSEKAAEHKDAGFGYKKEERYFSS